MQALSARESATATPVFWSHISLPRAGKSSAPPTQSRTNTPSGRAHDGHIPGHVFVVSLIIAFAVRFALAIYWLLFRKGHPAQPPPRRRGLGDQPSFVRGRIESIRAISEYAMRAAQQARMADRTSQPAVVFHDLREPIPADAYPAHGSQDAWSSLERALEPEAQACRSAPSAVSVVGVLSGPDRRRRLRAGDRWCAQGGSQFWARAKTGRSGTLKDKDMIDAASGYRTGMHSRHGPRCSM